MEETRGTGSQLPSHARQAELRFTIIQILVLLESNAQS